MLIPALWESSASWKDKAWIVGLECNGASKAYDWNKLKNERIINDMIGDQPVAIVLSTDGSSFFAYERSGIGVNMVLKNDTIIYANRSFDITGRDLDGTGSNLVPVRAYQEFWHSWLTFHPMTMKY